jgi:nuclear cap-binding protein subunit 1
LSNEPGYLLPDVFSSLSDDTRVEDEDASAPEEPFSLPYLLVPPEAEQLDLVRSAPTSQSSSGLRGDEGVGYDGVRLHFRLFDDEVSALESQCQMLEAHISRIFALH